VLVLAVLGLLVTLGWLGLVGGGPEESIVPSGSPVATSSAATSEAPSASALPSGSPAESGRPSIGSGIGVIWEQVGAFPGAAVHDVAQTSSGWVAVGANGPVACDACPGMEAYTGQIWRSADGRTWQAVPVSGLERSIVGGVAAGPDGLVAVGTREVDGVTQPMLLTSPDGTSWDLQVVPPFDAPGISIVDLVGGPIFVATGQVSLGGADFRPVIWTSSDGSEWHEAFRGTSAGTIGRIAASGSGWVAVGYREAPSTDPERSSIPMPAVWTSPDAVTWTQRDLPLGSGATAGVAHTVLASRLGWVAVGSAEYPPASADAGVIEGFAGWYSADGIVWQPSPVTDDFLEDIGGGLLLYQASDRVFALGSGCRCGPGVPGRWWTSADGLAWVEHPESPPALTAVIPFGNGLLATAIVDGQGAILVSE
jgi:hypothetical protein